MEKNGNAELLIKIKEYIDEKFKDGFKDFEFLLTHDLRDQDLLIRARFQEMDEKLDFRFNSFRKEMKSQFQELRNLINNK